MNNEIESGKVSSEKTTSTTYTMKDGTKHVEQKTVNKDTGEKIHKIDGEDIKQEPERSFVDVFEGNTGCLTVQLLAQIKGQNEVIIRLLTEQAYYLSQGHQPISFDDIQKERNK